MTTNVNGLDNPVQSRAGDVTGNTQSHWEGRNVTVVWGLGHESGRTWMGWFYTIGNLLANLISCNSSWNVTITLSSKAEGWLVTREWSPSQPPLNSMGSGLQEDGSRPDSPIPVLLGNSSSAISAGSGPISTIANGITSHMPNQAAAQEAIQSTVSINERFTRTESLNNQIGAHEEAKTWVKENLALVGSAIEFVSPPQRPTGLYSDVIIPQGLKLNREIFGWELTQGVTQDIQRDGRSQGQEINLYGVASQYNSGECPWKSTIVPGAAVFGYAGDPTQGPQAQISYSNEQAELINCGANKGFNGLIHVLDEETKGEIAHGYFTPSQEKYPQVLRQLQENGHKMEFSCVGGVPRGGTRRVYEMLVAAPAFGQYLSCHITGQPLTQEQQNNLAFVCAVHSWRAQFEECIALAKATGKPVHFKPAAIGLGVFGNKVEMFNKAFYKTAQEYQEQLVQNHVKVTFQVYGRTEERADLNAKAVADALLVKRTA